MRAIFSFQFVVGFLLQFLSVVGSMAQPASSYTIKASSNLTLTSQPFSPLGDCTQGTCVTCTSIASSYTQYGFESPSGFQSWPSTNPNAGLGNTVSVTVTPGSVGTSQTWKYISRRVDFYLNPSGTCLNSGGTSTAVFNITVNTIADLSYTGSFPTSLCQGIGPINLYSYLNKSSGVTFKEGATVIANTIDPLAFSVGAHTFTATYYFGNGATTVTLPDKSFDQWAEMLRLHFQKPKVLLRS